MTTLIIFSLAAFRLTHLLVFDKIFEPIRNYFVTRVYKRVDGQLHVGYRLHGGPVRRFIGQILNCPWCAGMWVSFLVVGLYVTGPGWLIWIYLALAAAGVVGVLETWWGKTVGFPPEMEPME